VTWDLEIENIGGILEAETTVEPGLNAVRASNWQGKSSFIGALKTLLGVETPLTEGKDQGYVRFDGPETSRTIELTQPSGTVIRNGEPLLEDEYDTVRTRLFACLGEENPVRNAVRSRTNLEDVLLEPLDFENIDEQIRELKREREQAETELKRATEAKKRRPEVRKRVNELETELETLCEEHEQLSASTDGTDDQETLHKDLAEAESERDRIANRINQLEQSIERTEASLAEKRSELEAIEITSQQDLAAELERARDELQALKRDKKVLQSLHSATDMVLSENRLDLVTDVEREVTGDTVVCWTCGAESSRDAIDSQRQELRERLTEIQARTDSKQEEVEQLEAKRESVTQDIRRKEMLESDIADLEEKLSNDTQSLESAKTRRSQLDDRIESMSNEVADTVERITDIESDIKYREAELEDARADLDQLEQRAAQHEMLEDEVASLTEELEQLRNRKSRIRRETREAFDETLSDLLDRFETRFETARLTPKFDLVVARDGREASLDALSEGELELLGFVAALAGYEAFDVRNVSPCILVDRVGGLTDENLQRLTDYLKARTEYLVFTTYPGFETGVEHEVSPTEWRIAAD
jgi:chromosome segregation ATPase